VLGKIVYLFKIYEKGLNSVALATLFIIVSNVEQYFVGNYKQCGQNSNIICPLHHQSLTNILHPRKFDNIGPTLWLVVSTNMMRETILSCCINQDKFLKKIPAI
jgi:hypothetical protein